MMAAIRKKPRLRTVKKKTKSNPPDKVTAAMASPAAKKAEILAESRRNLLAAKLSARRAEAGLNENTNENTNAYWASQLD